MLLHFNGRDDGIADLARICVSSFEFIGRFEAIVEARLKSKDSGTSADIIPNPSIPLAIRGGINAERLTTGTFYFDVEGMRIFVYPTTPENYDKLLRGERGQLPISYYYDFMRFLRERLLR